MSATNFMVSTITMLYESMIYDNDSKRNTQTM